MGTKRNVTSGKYITIAEYADIRGISTAAVYKRLEGTLKPWYRVINGKKCLLSSVLYQEGKLDLNENVNKSAETEEKEETENATDLTPVIAELRAQISQQQAEIGRQQAEADALRAAIQEKDKIIVDFAARFAELANQAQQLHAAATMIEAKSTAGKEDGPKAEKKRGRLARFLFGE